MDKNLKTPENIDKLIEMQARQVVRPVSSSKTAKVKTFGVYKKKNFNRNSK